MLDMIISFGVPKIVTEKDLWKRTKKIVMEMSLPVNFAHVIETISVVSCQYHRRLTSYHSKHLWFQFQANLYHHFRSFDFISLMRCFFLIG